MDLVPTVHPLTILLAATFTSNILLTNYLGMCSFLGASREVKTAAGLGGAVIFVMVTTTALNWIITDSLLEPLELTHFSYIVYIMLIAAFVQVVEMVIERTSDALYTALGIFLPLITVNCAILGTSLFMVIRNYTFVQSVAFGLGSGVGWTLAILAMAGIRQSMARARVPKGLEGAGITLVIAGIMALAFMGFSGMMRVQ